ncbi:MAG: hypothetical protein IKO20_09200 [Bacteroidaceae bacterium]|nr:hypothetical protein [Bacteroidaceae bacterium]
MITKSYFEAIVPSFRDCEDEIFHSIEPFLQNIAQSVQSEFELTQEQTESETIAPLFFAYVCKRTAYEALPHLDLILTANGFAVASNQNLTPASRQRVYDLRERLRREKSDARDALMQELNTCGLYAPHNLLWNATLCRKYGIRTKDGSQVYEEELQLVKTDIDAAQGKCAFIVSEEQMAELIAMQETMFYQDLIQLCRHFMAAYVKDDVNAIRTMMHRLQHYLNENADALPTYKGSSKYEADHFTPYENKIEDSCFFFG